MASLRNALWRLRKLGGASVIHTSRDNVSVVPQVWIDLAHVRRWAAEIDSGQPEPTDTQVIEMLNFDLLMGWEDDWLNAERERLRQLRIHALESLADTFVRQGRYAHAIQAALAAVRAEPLRETAQMALINAYLSEGNTSEAVRQFNSFRRLLVDELGLAPSARVESLLYAKVRRRTLKQVGNLQVQPVRRS